MSRTYDYEIKELLETRINGTNGRGNHGTEEHGHRHAPLLLPVMEPFSEGERKANIEAAVRVLLENVGEDPDRQGLQGTPDRIARMYGEVLGGYTQNIETLVNGALFDVEYDEMVVVKDIEFYSMCEHHMLPFFGRAHVAYIPGKQVIGLSKIPRLVDMYARRLQVQERMTRQIAETLVEILQPQGVAVVVEGQHMCSMMRGVKKQESSMTTSAMLGAFRENEKTRNEFLSHLK